MSTDEGTGRRPSDVTRKKLRRAALCNHAYKIVKNVRELFANYEP